MSGGPVSGSRQQWAASVNLATGDATKSIQASPGTGKKLVVQYVSWIVTTAAAQTYTIGDGTITLMLAPASHAVGNYFLDFGELGIPLTAATALSITPASAGVAAQVSAYGYLFDATGG